MLGLSFFFGNGADLKTDVDFFNIPDIYSDTISILPENIEALRLFDACQTCWRYGFDGKVLVLNYAQVSVAVSKLDFKNKVFADLKTMELSVVSHQK